MSAQPDPAAFGDEELMEELGSFAYDPYAFVLWAFPWGEPGELAKETGPDEWQKWLLCSVRDGLLTADEAMLHAITSGHGVGKSAIVAWLVWWSYSTFPGTRGVVTANTENQLKTKTWVEIAKWHRLFLAKHLFKCTATAIFSVDEDQSREWRIDIVPWSERNTEAFAGLHNAGKRIIILFDEASAIPDIIWETTEGALTDEDTEILWFVFGNPTRQTGRFRECFEDGKFAHRWKSKKVNSLDVKRTNKVQLNKWIDDYGRDSDFCKVRIFGDFPSADAQTFIDRYVMAQACDRVCIGQNNHPVVLGVDVARFGDDMSVIWPRQGRDASTRPVEYYQGIDTVALARHVVLAINKYNASAVFVDSGGVGGGVVDILRDQNISVFAVDFGSKPDQIAHGEKYANKRAEIYGLMRTWLRDSSVPLEIGGRNMIDEFTATTYGLNEKTNAIQLTPKAVIKKDIGVSPDFSDALATTFAFPILESNLMLGAPALVQPDYNPYETGNLIR